MCKQFLLASVGAIAMAGSAFAAEPAPVPPPPVPVFTWSGVYLGGQIGYAWGKDNVSWSGTANDLDSPAVNLARVRKGSSAAPMSATTSSLTHGSWPA